MPPVAACPARGTSRSRMPPSTGSKSARRAGRSGPGPTSPIFPWPWTTCRTSRPSDGERRLVPQRDLLFQLEDPVLPVALRAEPREGGWKGGIVPAARDPRRVVDEAQRTQRLDKVQLATVEFHELLVAGEHIGHAARHRGAVAGKQHPKVLRRGPHARIVEIDEMRALIGPQDIADVAIAVQADRPDGARALVAGGG